jgi:hypothetical protein
VRREVIIGPAPPVGGSVEDQEAVADGEFLVPDRYVDRVGAERGQGGR